MRLNDRIGRLEENFRRLEKEVEKLKADKGEKAAEAEPKKTRTAKAKSD